MNHEIEAKWREFAIHKGLALSADLEDPSGRVILRISGLYRGRTIAADAIIRILRSGELTQLGFYTRIVVGVNNSSGLVFWLRKRLLFGGKLRLGNRDLDSRFIVNGHPWKFVRSILTSPNVRQTLIRSNPLSMETSDKKLTLESLGVEADETNLLFMLNMLCEIAETMESHEV